MHCARRQRIMGVAAVAGIALATVIDGSSLRAQVPTAAAQAAQSVQAPSFTPTRLLAQGTPTQVGQQVGRAYQQAIRQLHPSFLGLAMLVTRQTKQQLYQRAGQLAAFLDEQDIQEMRGLATASGLAYEDVLFLNSFYSLAASSGKMIACRQLVAWGQATADGQLLHARNLDWRDYPGSPLQRHNLVLNVKPAQGMQYMILTWPGLMSAITGMNEAGLSVAFNVLPGGKVEREAEMTFFTLKRVLRSSQSVEEAIELIRAARPMDNGSIMLADAKRKKAAVVELFDGQVGVRWANGEAMIGNANHATIETGIEGAPTGGADAPTCIVARSLLPLTVSKAQQVMRHPRVLADHNILSVVFAAEENRMWLSAGRRRAAQGEFIAVAIFPDHWAQAGQPITLSDLAER